MNSLRKLQEDFAQQVFSKHPLSASSLQEIICENGIPSFRRLQVYQNNILASLTESLQAVYPIVERLVGKDFFRYMAEEYIILNPSRSGDLHAYGKNFSEFLSHFAPAQTVPYLPEVAQLEWGYHEVFHAADHDGMDIKRLHNVSPANYEKIKFQLHPASRLFAFHFPVSYICEICANENNSDENITLPAHGEKILLMREAQEIEMKVLSLAEFTFLSSFNNNENLSAVCEKVLALDEHFDIEKSLQQNILRKVIVEFVL
jgi:hypothetical protein